MVTALIVIGNARNFLIEAAEVKIALQALGMHVDTFRSCYAGAETVLQKVASFFRKKATAHLLIYIGHGCEIGWDLDGTDREVVRNSQLIALVEKARTPVVLINDCCYPIRLIESVRYHAPALAEKLLVIASCNPDETSNSTVSKRAAGMWSERQSFAPKKRVVDVLKFDFGPKVRRRRFIDLGEPIKATVMRSFKTPPSELRWGAELDHLMYARE